LLALLYVSRISATPLRHNIATLILTNFKLSNTSIMNDALLFYAVLFSIISIFISLRAERYLKNATN
jgi:hypothetical protein